MEEHVTTLDDVCEMIVDCEHKTAPSQDTGYPSIRTPNIGRGRLILEGVNRVSKEVYRQWTQRAVPQVDDLILAREAPVGNVAIIPPNLRVCLGQRTVLIRPDKTKVNPHYLLYLLLGKEIQDRIQSLTGGTTVPHLNMSDIRALSLPKIPNREIQDKIASILSNYDELIENDNKRIRLLERISRTIYEEWFIKFRFPGYDEVGLLDSELGRIPEGWELVSVSDVAEVCRGRSYRTADLVEDGGLPFLNLKSVKRGGGYQGSGLKRYGGRFKETQSAKPGDIIIAVTDMTQGRGVIAHPARVPITGESDYVLSMDLVKIVPKEGISNDYLYSMLRYSSFSDEVKQKASGTNVLHLKPDAIEEYQFPLPNKSLIDSFSGLSARIFEHASALEERCKHLRQTRDLLIPQLLSGRIDVATFDIDGKGEAS